MQFDKFEKADKVTNNWQIPPKNNEPKYLNNKQNPVECERIVDNER